MYIYIYIPIFIYNSTHIFISICTRIFSRGYSCVMHSILVHAHTFRLIQGVFESSQLCVPWVVACVTWLTYVCTAFYFRTRTHTHTRTVCVCVMVHGPWVMSRVTWLTCTHVCTEFNIVHTHYRLILDSWSVGLELHLFHERHRAFVTRSRSWALLSRRAAAYHVRGRCIACFESCHVCFRRVMSHVSHVPCMCLLHSTWERCHWLCAKRRIQCVFGVYSVFFFSHQYIRWVMSHVKRLAYIYGCTSFYFRTCACTPAHAVCWVMSQV